MTPDLIDALPYVVAALAIIILPIAREILRVMYMRSAKRAHARARDLHRLRQGIARAERMAVQTNRRTKNVVFGYIARVEQQAYALGVSEIYCVDPIVQTAVRRVAGLEVVK